MGPLLEFDNWTYKIYVPIKMQRSFLGPGNSGELIIIINSMVLEKTIRKVKIYNKPKFYFIEVLKFFINIIDWATNLEFTLRWSLTLHLLYVFLFFQFIVLIFLLTRLVKNNNVKGITRMVVPRIESGVSSLKKIRLFFIDKIY